MTAVEKRLDALEEQGSGGGGGGSGNEQLEQRLEDAEDRININERDIKDLEIGTNEQIRSLENKVISVELDTVNNFQSLGDDLTNYVDRIDS